MLSLVGERDGGSGVSTTGGGLDLSLDLSLTANTPSSSVGVPNVDGPAGDVDEARDDDEEGDSGVEMVRDGSLHGREDGTTRDTHDDEGRGSSGVSTETGGGEDEDDRVHDRLEEHDDDGEVDTSLAVDATDHDGDDGAGNSVDPEEDGSGDDGEESGTDKSSDGKGDETVRQESRALAVGDTSLLGQEEEEGTDGDLGTDVEELSDETRDGSVLLVEGLGSLGVESLGLGKSLSLSLQSLLGDLGKLGEGEEEGDEDTHTGDGHVDKLDASERGAVLIGEEVLGSDEGSSERGDTVEGLGELKSEVGNVVGGHDGYVRVGGDLEGSQTTSDDGGANDETTKDGTGVRGSGKLGDRPEEDGTDRVEAKSHDDGELVTSSLQNLSGDGREGKVSDTKVSSLKTGRLGFSDTEDISEVGVEDVEETVGETPKEEERGDEDESPDWDVSYCGDLALWGK